MRRRIPSGSVFQQAYTDRRGKLQHTKIWYVRYYVNRVAKTLSSGTEDRDEAVAFLRGKMADSARQIEYGEYPERVRMDQLFDLLLDNYRLLERASTYDLERKIESRLRPYFGRMKAQSITTNVLLRYIASRRSKDPRPANASINRELACLRRAMKLGAQQDPPLVLRVPHFTMLREDNIREGTLSHENYIAVRDALPPYARLALVIAYHTGARKGEIRQILIDRVDLRARKIDLPARTTKTKLGRYLPIYGDMAAEIDMAISAAPKGCRYLIQKDGKPVANFRKAWASACKAAGIPDALFHDLRRTAVTNMLAAGFQEHEAMLISGHRTRAVFDRYHVVSERRMNVLIEKLEAHHLAVEAAADQGKKPKSLN